MTSRTIPTGTLAFKSQDELCNFIQAERHHSAKLACLAQLWIQISFQAVDKGFVPVSDLDMSGSIYRSKYPDVWDQVGQKIKQCGPIFRTSIQPVLIKENGIMQLKWRQFGEVTDPVPEVDGEYDMCEEPWEDPKVTAKNRLVGDQDLEWIKCSEFHAQTPTRDSNPSQAAAPMDREFCQHQSSVCKDSAQKLFKTTAPALSEPFLDGRMKDVLANALGQTEPSMPTSTGPVLWNSVAPSPPRKPGKDDIKEHNWQVFNKVLRAQIKAAIHTGAWHNILTLEQRTNVCMKIYSHLPPKALNSTWMALNAENQALERSNTKEQYNANVLQRCKQFKMAYSANPGHSMSQNAPLAPSDTPRPDDAAAAGYARVRVHSPHPAIIRDLGSRPHDCGAGSRGRQRWTTTDTDAGAAGPEVPPYNAHEATNRGSMDVLFQALTLMYSEHLPRPPPVTLLHHGETLHSLSKFVAGRDAAVARDGAAAALSWVEGRRLRRALEQTLAMPSDAAVVLLQSTEMEASLRKMSAPATRWPQELVEYSDLLIRKCDEAKHHAMRCMFSKPLK